VVSFRRTDRSAALVYKIYHGNAVLPDRISRHKYAMGLGEAVLQIHKTYPAKEKIQRKLLTVHQACRYESGEIWPSGWASIKLFLDSLRKVQAERKSIANFLAQFKEAQPIRIPWKETMFQQFKCTNCGAMTFELDDNTVRTVVDGETSLLRCNYCGSMGMVSRNGIKYDLLKCSNCGAGTLEIGVSAVKTADGEASLLRCNHCGFEGIISKHGTEYDVNLPKLQET